MKPSERIEKIMFERDNALGLLIEHKNNMPFHGPLWALLQYLDELAEQGEKKC